MEAEKRYRAGRARTRCILGVALSLLVLMTGCTKKKGRSGIAYAASIELSRVPGGDYSPFVVKFTAQSGSIPTSGLAVTITAAGAGATVSAVTDHADGTYSATVTPAYSGEVRVQATIAEWNLNRQVTAVVLKHVANGWGQPTAVAGSVNTTGWEDSLSISADGQWLLLLYSPVSISGILNGDANHPWAKQVSGPFTGALRPNFPRNRIAADGTVTYSYPLFGVTDTGGPWPPPTATYGFRRQPDGSFAQPFLIGPDDSGNGALGGFGACLAPTGNAARPLCVFAFNDPSTVRTGDISDIVFAPIQLGQTNILGHYTAHPVTHVISSADTPLVTVGIDTAGHQGNPCAYADLSNNIESVWTDDETAAEQDVSVQSVLPGGNFPAGPWGVKMTPPAPVNLPGVSEIQPFFDGAQLLVRRGDTITAIQYLGGDFDQPGAWGTTTVLIDSETTLLTGRIVTVGEPSLAVVGGKTELYFIYAKVGDYDAAAKSYKLDLDAAVVRTP